MACSINAQTPTWRSNLYPKDWTPEFNDNEGRFLHDFSYAGYHRGEKPLPRNLSTKVYDVTKPPYSLDTAGQQDATVVIQRAIDDAGDAGGGIVYLPEGTYNVAPIGENNWSLRISQDGVILRGAGRDKTFLCNTATYMRKKNVILFQPLTGDWHEPLLGTEISLVKDIESRSHEVALSSTDGLKSGDLIILYSDCTEAFASEFGMEDFWPNKIPGLTFCRQIKKVDNSSNVITIDIPTRYRMKMRDHARIYKVAPHLKECGIEDLSIGMVENTVPYKGFSAHNTPGNGSYEMNGCHLIQFKHAYNGWIQGVNTYKPNSNNKIHMLSNGLLLSKSSLITIKDCKIEWAQFRGNGGNGYGITLRGNDCLVQNCVVNECRHNYSMKSMTCSGNVFLHSKGMKSKLPSDYHMHMSLANLFDCMTVEKGDWLSAVYRKAGTVMHGHCTTESVFWNSHGKGGGKGKPGSKWHWDGKSLVCSSQWGHGYVIGTSGSQYKVTLTEDMSSAPLDFLEGEGKGKTLEPQSLYKDQLKRRLNK